MYRLDYIMAIAEEKSITKAAAKLYVTQPTLTKYLSKLEDELGVKLFDRSISPIQITRAGQVFNEDMRKIQNREIALKAKLQSLNQEKITLTMGMPMVRSEYILPGTIARFLRKYPEVNINADPLYEGTIESALMKHDIRLGLGILSLAYDELQYKLVQEHEILVLIPRDSKEGSVFASSEATYENPAFLNPEVLNGRRQLVPSAYGGQYQAAQVLLKRHDIVPGSEVHCNNLHTLYEMVARGCGFLVTTPGDFVVRFPQHTDKIAFCRVQDEVVTQKVYIAYRKDEAEDPMLQDMITIIEDEAKKHWTYLPTRS